MKNKQREETKEFFENKIDRLVNTLRQETMNHISLLRKSTEATEKELRKVINKNSTLTMDIYKNLKKYADDLSLLKETSKNLEETLCNVLLAIRQNEYLQAYYPEQHGFNEMKVVGIHPAKTKE